MGFPRLVAATISGVVLFVSAPAISQASTPTDTATAHQVFEGVFFQHGPLARRVPTEIQGTQVRALLPSKWDAQTQHAALRLESDIAKHDPGFFASFAADVTSGDPGLVKIAMERTVADVKFAAAQERVTLPKSERREVAIVAPPISVQNAVYVSQVTAVVAVHIAGLVYIAATIYIAAAVAIVAIVGDTTDSDSIGGGGDPCDFVSDSLTARLANNFSTVHVSGV